MTRSWVKVTSPPKLEICFQLLSPPPFTIGAGNWPLILKLWYNIYIFSGRFLIFILVFVSRDFELGTVRPSVCASVRPQKFLRFWQNLARRYRSMSDARWYAVWPDPRSRSLVLQNWKSCHFQKLSPPFTTGAGNRPLIAKLGEYLNLIGSDFWYFSWFSC